ncbi:hypothetical protein [Piscinibacter sp.]|uniref:hypothetical protein n=1 Tax=Piscinibacter sp. TaxID=1903157 RepID=UPI0039E64818
MSVNHVAGVGRVMMPATSGRTADQTGTTQTQAQAAEAAEGAKPSLVEIDENTNQPVPPRFPWLSRLTRELEPASKQPSPYGSVPLLGEKLDRQA